MSAAASENRKPRVIVVGAGLAGCLTSLLLSQRGFAVDVYEFRSDPSARPAEAGVQRSINLALSTRGLTALAEAGLAEPVRALGVPMHGRCVHPVSGAPKLQRYGQPGQHLLSVSRGALNALLLRACARAEDVRVHFEHKCVSVVLREGAARFALSDGSEVEKRADFVVGADGTFSRVRAAFMREDMFDYAQQYIPAAYKELRLDARGAHNMPPEWLHIWPRHRFMLIALPNAGGSFTCTLFMDRADFEKLKRKDEIEQFFEANFPDARRLMPQIADDFLAAPTPSLLTVRCAPYHFQDKAVLVGDAAHAIVPFYGQGCNAAFEDCRVLAELFDAHGTRDIGKVLAEFTRMRKENADIIADLALDNYVDMASRTAQPGLVFRRKVGIWMNRLFPRYWLPLYSMISFSNIPYKTALQRAEAQDRSLSRTVKVAAMAVALSATVRMGCWAMRQTKSGQ